MTYTDMHIHALAGVDDGARDEATMLAMVEASYADGVRAMVLTPHCHPGYFGNNFDAVERAYARLREEAAARWPGLALGLGNELRYEQGCVQWLAEGRCRTMNGSDYVLVDFFEDDDARRIHEGLDRLLNAGYVPVLAHVERYAKLRIRDVREFRANRVLIQVDAQSLLGGFGFGAQRRCKAYLKERLADFAGSDAHGLAKRPPGLSRFRDAAARIAGADYANAICGPKARRAFFGDADADPNDRTNRRE